MVYHRTLMDFIAKARTRTWAGGTGKRAPKRDGSEGVFVYLEGDLRYEDEYFGAVRFQGQEIVYLKDKPFWGMVYFGGVPEGVEVNADEEFAFLKKALVSKAETARLLGTTDFKDANHSYHCSVKGSIDNFYGKEITKNNGQTTHEMQFYGGIIKLP